MARKSQIGLPLIGVGIRTPSPWVCEVLAAAGYDLVWIDGEHGSLSAETIDGLILLSRSLGLKTYVRVTTPGRAQIQHVLDAGADGVVLPQVRDLAHARKWADYTKYPPLGLRGMGTPRSLCFEDAGPGYVSHENVRTKCFIMIETPGALADVESIVALPTVDGLFMGPYDLSLTCGRGQYAATPDDWADADRIAAAAASAGKLFGMQGFSQDGIVRAVRYGASVITVGDEVGALANALRSNLGKMLDYLATTKTPTATAD